jgi:hypothetical protein
MIHIGTVGRLSRTPVTPPVMCDDAKGVISSLTTGGESCPSPIRQHPMPTHRSWFEIELPDFQLKGKLSGLLQAAAVMAASTAGLWVSMAVAAVQTTYYVSPTGSESSCSQARPCSLATAQVAVEALTAGMTGDLVVLLQAGTYILSSTLTFTPADSGQNGHNVMYEALAYGGLAPRCSTGYRPTRRSG